MLKQEEERFAKTLENGMEILEARARRAARRCSTARPRSSCYDTFGFPVDLTADVCRERGVTVDIAGFDAAMEQQRERARAAGKFKMAAGLEYSGRADRVPRLREAGASRREGRRAVRRRRAGAAARSAARQAVVVLDHTPFYAEVGRPGRRHRASSSQRERHVRRRRHAEDPGRRVRPPRHAEDRARCKVGDASSAKVDTERARAHACATTRPRT